MIAVSVSTKGAIVQCPYPLWEQKGASLGPQSRPSTDLLRLLTLPLKGFEKIGRPPPSQITSPPRQQQAQGVLGWDLNPTPSSVGVMVASAFVHSPEGLGASPAHSENSQSPGESTQEP